MNKAIHATRKVLGVIALGLCFALPASAQTYKGVRQQFVKLGATRGDQIAVLSGINPKEEIVTSGLFKLRTGVAVLVNNSVQPGNNPAARPEDR